MLGYFGISPSDSRSMKSWGSFGATPPGTAELGIQHLNHWATAPGQTNQVKLFVVKMTVEALFLCWSTLVSELGVLCMKFQKTKFHISLNLVLVSNMRFCIDRTSLITLRLIKCRKPLDSSTLMITYHLWRKGKRQIYKF